MRSFKSRSLVCIIAAAGMLIPISPAYAYTSSGRIIFEDDFSDYSQNGRVAYHPGGSKLNSSMAPFYGWKWAEAYNTTTENGIIAESEGYNRFAKLYTQGSDEPVSLISSEFGEYFNTYVISARIKITDAAGCGIGLVNADADTSIGFPLEKLIYFQNGTVYKNIGSGSYDETEYTYNTDTWYNIRFCIDRSAYKYSVRMYDGSDSDISINDSIPSTARKNKIRFGFELSGGAAGSMCVDDVFICKTGTQKIALSADEDFKADGNAAVSATSGSIVMNTEAMLVIVPEQEDIMLLTGDGSEQVTVKGAALDKNSKKLTVTLGDALQPGQSYKLVLAPAIRNVFGHKIEPVDICTAQSTVSADTPQIYVDGAAADTLKAGKLSCTVNAITDGTAEPCIVLALYKGDTMISIAEGDGTETEKGVSAQIRSADIDIPSQDTSSYKLKIYLWDKNSKAPLSSYYELDTNQLLEVN